MSEPTLAPSIHPRLRALLPEDGPTLDEVKAHQRPENEIPLVLHAAREIAHGVVEHRLIEEALEFGAHKLFGAAAEKIVTVGNAFLVFQAM